MMTITKAVRRALGEGVQRLRDGDRDDCALADEVVAEMRGLGFVLAGYTFISHNQTFVTGHLHPHGIWTDALTDTEKSEALAALGVLPEELQVAVKTLDFGALPESVIEQLAATMREIRQRKGLRFEPTSLQDEGW